jgi:hypothetical protein
MGKRKLINKKLFKRLAKRNRLLLAAIGGAADGIAISAIMGSDKAKQILQTVEDNVKGFNAKFQNGTHKESSLSPQSTY